MVRDIKTLDELIDRSRDISMSPEPLRAQRRRSFAYGNTTIANPNIARNHARGRSFRAHLRLEMN